ncbi:unnamed protein product [Rotaria sordida]|uniref:Uncharacterized protein n=2 Tax=Rotaria sordida TaxID=392033 RepID=A0A820DY09_9BILA|nr:unnamed protein product [Rotaria sordida]
MKKDYVADGWLGFILGTRMYIDFGTYDFDKAIQLLENEIRLQKKKRKDAKEVAKMEKKIEIDNQNKKNVNEEIESHHNGIEEAMNFDNILNWNENVVRDFLMRKNLSDFLPLCHGINGNELNNLYDMCRNNSALMYDALTSELLKLHDKFLPISTYLHFMSRLGAVCADNLPLNPLIYRKYLEEYLHDDE